jgi:hypothetical protein
MAALADTGLSDQELAQADPSSLDATTKKIGDLALVGSMVWSEKTLGWVADWRLAAPGGAYRWQIRGVGFDEAFRNAMAGAAQVLSGHGQPG